MKDPYLEVTYRKGKPLAAYLYLPRPTGVRSARTREAAPGIIVDYAPTGEPIGLEITAPQSVTASDVNGVLAGLGLPSLPPEELRPLRAA